MSGISVTRRHLLKSAGLLVLAMPVLQACGGAPAASPSAGSPAASGQASTTASQSAGQATAAPAAQAAASGAKVAMSVAVWTDPVRTWQKKFAQDWAQKNPNVTLKIDEITYNDMAKKQLAELATGTLQDLTYNSIKWIDYNIYKGAFLPIDSYVKTKDPGIADFIPVSIESGKWEGKLYALPSEVNTGNQNIVIYNKDLLDAKGVKPPTDDWKQTDFLDMATKLNDPANKVYGTDYFPGTYYDYGALLLGNGAQILSDDGKQFLLSDPKSVTLAQWVTELRTKYKVAPARADAQAISFPAGKIALHTDGVQSIIALKKTIADKFKFDAVLGPTGPEGRRGFDSFVLNWAIYAKSKVPETAYELMLYFTADEQQRWSFANQGQPPTRKAIWDSDIANQINPVWGRALKWITNGIDKGPFPVPWNLRYTELEDKWENEGYGIFYGEVPLSDGIQKVQADCQAIVSLPRP
ncbi:MAG TPA: sugar ABC transporter substrate-binding protein [Chloroflexota bacterium]|nr:sugar ABC transporter substrate-binding protein [Chloroflexota bacterium]